MNHVYACINQNPCGSTKEYITRIPYLNYVSGGVVHVDKHGVKNPDELKAKIIEALTAISQQNEE